MWALHNSNEDGVDGHSRHLQTQHSGASSRGRSRKGPLAVHGPNLLAWAIGLLASPPVRTLSPAVLWRPVLSGRHFHSARGQLIEGLERPLRPVRLCRNSSRRSQVHFESLTVRLSTAAKHSPRDRSGDERSYARALDDDTAESWLRASAAAPGGPQLAAQAGAGRSTAIRSGSVASLSAAVVGPEPRPPQRTVAVVAGHWIDPGGDTGAPHERDFNMEARGGWLSQSLRIHPPATFPSLDIVAK